MNPWTEQCPLSLAGSPSSFDEPNEMNRDDEHPNADSVNNQFFREFSLAGSLLNSCPPLTGFNHSQPPAVTCKFFAQGHCSRGDHCSFVHDSLPNTLFTSFPLQPPIALCEDFLGNSARFSSSKNCSEAVSTTNSEESHEIRSFEEIPGHVFDLARDQHGCRLLQKFLDEDENSLALIFAESFENINDLMTDPFGNYLCQKLMEMCSPPQRLALVSRVANNLVTISLNIHGTRVVQKMIEVVSGSEEISLIVDSLKQHVVTLTKDLNGNHVVQRCLYHLLSSSNQFIYDAICDHCVSVATHKHGCCVLQRCLDYASDSQRMQLINVITENALDLVQDAFGNYVVQYVLDLGNEEISHNVIRKMLGHLPNLSVQKFSSNVVEKCLLLANAMLREEIIDELFHPDRLSRMLMDPYANYVIQKSLTVCRSEKFNELLDRIRPHLATLRGTSFGKRILAKILKKFPALNQPLASSVQSSSSSKFLKKGNSLDLSKLSISS